MRTRNRALSERVAFAGLVLVTLLFRLPFISRFDFVSFDGTHYINQARALLHGSLSGGAFPIGYPLLIAPVLLIVRDGVLAGSLVSLMAAIGSVLLVYLLARRYVARPYALAAASMLATTPLFIDASLATLSESLYVFWVLLSLWYFSQMRMARSGLSLGMAAATRPEALAIAAVLGLMRVRSLRALASFALAFVLVYGASVATLSATHGRLTLLSRAGSYQSLATSWSLREKRLEFSGKDELERRMLENAEPYQRGRSYVWRLPQELGRLGRHALPALPGLALLYLGYRRKKPGEAPETTPWFALAALAPLPFIPLFTEDRGIMRWLVPYVAPLILFGVIGLARAASRRTRLIAAALTGTCVIVSLVVNQRAIGHGIESDLRSTRDVARRFAARIEPGDAIADRKPYFAFYAGAKYSEIPVSPYDVTIGHLASSHVRYLALHPASVMKLRKAMRPLLFDRAVMRGEFRYRQVQFATSGEVVYERVAEHNPLTARRLTTPETADNSPAWSPDGRTIAFRRQFNDGTSAVMLMDSSGAGMREILRTEPMLDALAWSPDGRQIAYATHLENKMILNLCDVATGRSRSVSAPGAQCWNPAWCRRTGAFLFCRDDRGSQVVLKAGAPGREGTQVSLEEPADFASISPSGAWISWVDPAGRLVLLEVANGSVKKIREPLEILSPASWSPDEACVLVEAFDWGSPNLYMIDVRDGRSLRMTASHRGTGTPAWSPAGGSAVVVSGRDGNPALWMLGNLQRYVTRLKQPDDVQAFERPAETRRPAPPGTRRFRAEARR